MEQIRFGTFETNSSSTHTVSIRVNKPKLVKNDIPRNSLDVFKIYDYEVCNGEESESIENILMSEISKTAFILKVIGHYLEGLFDDLSDDDFKKIYLDRCGKESIDINDPIEFKKSMSEDLIYTKWLKDVVYEETGTRIEFELKHVEGSYSNKYFPYTSVPYNEGKSDDEFYDSLTDSLREENEHLFKSLCREIIFNKDIIIVDKDEAYYSSYKITYL